MRTPKNSLLSLLTVVITYSCCAQANLDTMFPVKTLPIIPVESLARPTLFSSFRYETFLHLRKPLTAHNQKPLIVPDGFSIGYYAPQDEQDLTFLCLDPEIQELGDTCAETIQEAIAQKKTILVARSDNDQKTCGIAILNPECIELLAVAKEYRKKGLAQALLCLAEQNARVQGRKTLDLQVKPHNSSALAFYGKCGYTFKKRVRAYNSNFLKITSLTEDPHIAD